jgi:hypothetical protein
MPDTLRFPVFDSTAADGRFRSNRSATFGKTDHATVGYGTTIQIRIVREKGAPVTFALRGELDITSMGSFEQALAQVMAQSPPALLFDLTECEFVSAQGYEAIGRCSATAPVEVRSLTDMASKVFAIFGYDRVVSVRVHTPTHDRQP